MTEKELRGYIKGAIEIYEALEQKGFDSGGIPMILNAALAADPDMVGALRVLAESVAEHDKLKDDDGTDWNAGYEYGWYDASVSLAYQLEQQFHVRLTDDGGYEWTD